MQKDTSVLFILDNTMYHRNSVSQNIDILFSTFFLILGLEKLVKNNN